MVDALCNYAEKSAREHWAENLTAVYCSPRLSSWDAFQWFELVGDRDLADFVISGTVEAKRLLRNLQALLEWRGQTELEGILLSTYMPTEDK